MEFDKLILKFMWKCKGHISQDNFEEVQSGQICHIKLPELLP